MGKFNRSKYKRNGHSYDLAGERFGRLLAIKPVGKSNHNSTIWECQCDCGSIKNTTEHKLVSGNTKSCGCITKENVRILHEKKVKSETSFNTLYGSYYGRAKRKGLLFSLTKEQFKDIILFDCYYCGKPPSQIQKTRRGQTIYNGIDRKNPEEGYTLENCVPCCKDCNFAKLKMGHDEFLYFIKRIYFNLDLGTYV